MTPIDRSALRTFVRERLFTAAPDAPSDAVGMEVELVPVHRGSGRLALPEAAGTGTRPILDALAERAGWTVGRSPAGAPRYLLEDGSAFSFEPGGQIEYSSAIAPSVPVLLERIGDAVECVRTEMCERGIELRTWGIDPERSAGDAPLVLDTPRYRRMARHLDRYGPAGRRMMRQTAALHLNVELGPEPFERWALANRLAPFLVAVFANSAVYEGRATGHRSFRAHQWRVLDPARGGLVLGSDPVEAYLDFALAAPALFLGDEGAPCRPFAEWLDRGEADLDAWTRHLTTLFPEVRPRGYLEVRSFDALPPREYAAPLVFILGILWDAAAGRAAAEVLPEASMEGLVRAGRVGVSDPEIRARAVRLWEIALAGAERIGERIGSDAREVATSFFHRYTARGLDPAARGLERSNARAG